MNSIEDLENLRGRWRNISFVKYKFFNTFKKNRTENLDIALPQKSKTRNLQHHMEKRLPSKKELGTLRQDI